MYKTKRGTMFNQNYYTNYEDLKNQNIHFIYDVLYNYYPLNNK